MSDQAFQDWVARAKGADIYEVASRITTLKKAGRDFFGPCPKCGSKDNFVITPSQVHEKRWMCRNVKGGGIVAMVCHAQGYETQEGKDFLAACEYITGEPPPRGESAYRERSPEVIKEEKEERFEEMLEAHFVEKDRLKSEIAKCRKLWERGQPFAGSHGEAYLKRRCITLTPAQQTNLRFIPSLPYWGDVDDSQHSAFENLGSFPCIIAAIRDPQMNLIGIHRTYLDREQPKKLEPPGSRDNKAKKMSGQAKGGLIYLGPVLPCMAVGEGIETTASWYALGIGPDDVGIAVACSLGNMAGSAMSQVPHPRPPKDRPKITVDDGNPNMDEPGMKLPYGVEMLILLGDGDGKNGIDWTKQRLLTAAERAFRDEIKPLIHFAPEGMDWNNVLVKQRASL